MKIKIAVFRMGLSVAFLIGALLTTFVNKSDDSKYIASIIAVSTGFIIMSMGLTNITNSENTYNG